MLETNYKPVQSIKTFQPLQPFKPFTSFEAPKPFESLKSFELVKQVEESFSQEKIVGGEFPEGYEPVKPLSPLKPFDLEPIYNTYSKNMADSSSQKNTHAEIKEENIKNSLKEIILDLDNFVEIDKQLKDSKNEQENTGIPKIVVNGGPAFPKSGTEQVS